MASDGFGQFDLFDELPLAEVAKARSATSRTNKDTLGWAEPIGSSGHPKAGFGPAELVLSSGTACPTGNEVKLFLAA